MAFGRRAAWHGMHACMACLVFVRVLSRLLAFVFLALGFSKTRNKKRKTSRLFVSVGRWPAFLFVVPPGSGFWCVTCIMRRPREKFDPPCMFVWVVGRLRHWLNTLPILASEEGTAGRWLQSSGDGSIRGRCDTTKIQTIGPVQEFTPAFRRAGERRPPPTPANPRPTRYTSRQPRVPGRCIFTPHTRDSLPDRKDARGR